MPYTLLQPVEYYSTTHGSWIPCQVVATRGDGAIQVNVKKDFWIEPNEVDGKIRGIAARFSVGQPVEMLCKVSEYAFEWRPCTVETVQPDGSVSVNGRLYTVHQQDEVFRDPAARYQIGESVEYRSVTLKQWILCQIVNIRETDGAVMVNAKQGAWIKQLKTKIRRPVEQNAHFTKNEFVHSIPPTGFSMVSIHPRAQTRAIVTYNTYNWEPLNNPCGKWGKWGPIDTQFGANIFKDLLRSCGVTDITEVCEQNYTAQNIHNAIQSVGTRCDVDDNFIFYYTGHGATMPDQDGDEDDGLDEAICAVGPLGQECSMNTWIRDDDFADWLAKYVHAGRLYVLMDCCHSGTIVDLNKPCWYRKQAISMSGCKDNQEASATGRGGVFTHSMCNAVHEHAKLGKKDYCCGELYNKALECSKPIMAQHHSKTGQDISIQTSPGTFPHTLAWPLIPL